MWTLIEHDAESAVFEHDNVRAIIHPTGRMTWAGVGIDEDIDAMIELLLMLRIEARILWPDATGLHPKAPSWGDGA